VYSFGVGGWQLSVTTFTPTASPVKIEFHGMPGDGVAGGAHIDDVVLMQEPPPTIICPNDITLNTAGSSLVVNYPAPTVTGGALVGCAPPSGSLFLPGTTPITCMATNACGTNTCTFSVTVLQVICPTNGPNLVINGSFENPVAAVDDNDFFAEGLTGWDTSEASAQLEFWNGTFGSMAPQEGNQHLEITASSRTATVSQTLANLNTNCPATLCFYYTGRLNFDNHFTVELSDGSGGVLLTQLLNPPAYGNQADWLLFHAILVSPPATLTIAFTVTGSGLPGGAHIDDVVLMQDCAPCPPNPALHIALEGGNIVISWSGTGYRLEAATALANPSSATVWSSVSGTSPVTLPASGPQRFFRLVCP